MCIYLGAGAGAVEERERETRTRATRRQIMLLCKIVCPVKIRTQHLPAAPSQGWCWCWSPARAGAGPRPGLVGEPALKAGLAGWRRLFQPIELIYVGSSEKLEIQTFRKTLWPRRILFNKAKLLTGIALIAH